MNLGVLIRLAAIGFAAITPFMLILFFGLESSLSTYWLTAGQPLFILANVITSYFFFTIKEWRMPSYLLVLLTAFSVQSFPMTHNILAVLFFIAAGYSFYHIKRLKWYFILFVSCLPLLSYSLLHAEIGGILVLCAYHAHILIYKQILMKSNG